MSEADGERRRVLLTEALADPHIVNRLTGDEIADLRFQCYGVLDRLANAYIVARSRELTEAMFPKAFIRNQLMDVREVARCLNITKPAVYAMIRSGELPSVRVGKKYLKVPIAAVTQYLAKLAHEAESERPRKRGT